MSLTVSETEFGWQVIVTRFVATSQEKAFAALTQSEHLDQWFSKESLVDLRPGGRYSNADGDHGTFLIIEPFRLIRFTWEQKQHQPGSEVQITVRSTDDGVLVELLHDQLIESDAKDLSTGGWVWALDSLKSYLETGHGIAYGDWTSP